MVQLTHMSEPLLPTVMKRGSADKLAIWRAISSAASLCIGFCTLRTCLSRVATAVRTFASSECIPRLIDRNSPLLMLTLLLLSLLRRRSSVWTRDMLISSMLWSVAAAAKPWGVWATAAVDRIIPTAAFFNAANWQSAAERAWQRCSWH